MSTRSECRVLSGTDLGKLNVGVASCAYQELLVAAGGKLHTFLNLAGGTPPSGLKAFAPSAEERFAKMGVLLSEKLR